jgi:ABC-type multidrug transport system ATPase subunit
MLTGDVDPTRGDSSVVGFDVKTQFSQARKQIGY